MNIKDLKIKNVTATASGTTKDQGKYVTHKVFPVPTGMVRLDHRDVR